MVQCVFWTMREVVDKGSFDVSVIFRYFNNAISLSGSMRRKL